MSRIAPTTTDPTHLDSEEADIDPTKTKKIHWRVAPDDNIEIHARHKRAATGGIKYIETGIFVDRHMYEAVDKTKPPNTVTAIVNIVMAILHQVQLIYEYQSMTAYDFKLIIVKFEILRNTKVRWWLCDRKLLLWMSRVHNQSLQEYFLDNSSSVISIPDFSEYWGRKYRSVPG